MASRSRATVRSRSTSSGGVSTVCVAPAEARTAGLGRSTGSAGGASPSSRRLQ
nr:hypothetical protein [Streptosporangium amethystogenes]